MVSIQSLCMSHALAPSTGILDREPTAHVVRTINDHALLRIDFPPVFVIGGPARAAPCTRRSGPVGAECKARVSQPRVARCGQRMACHSLYDLLAL
jgi:hypothetical protein